MSVLGSSQAGVAVCTFLAGLLLAVDFAPGPAFSAQPAWAAAVKVAHGYLAYMGLNAGVAAAVAPRVEPVRQRKRAWAEGFGP